MSPRTLFIQAAFPWRPLASRAALFAHGAVTEPSAWRGVDKTVDVLAAWTSGFREALVGLGEGDFVIVDGTLILSDRIAADEPYHSRKHRKRLVNVQVITPPGRHTLRRPGVSGQEPSEPLSF